MNVLVSKARFIALLLIITTLVFTTVSPAMRGSAAITEYQVLVVTKDHAPIRSGPSKSNETIAKVDFGSLLYAERSFENDANNLWWQIRYNGNTKGYIFSGNVNDTGNRAPYPSVVLKHECKADVKVLIGSVWTSKDEHFHYRTDNYEFKCSHCSKVIEKTREVIEERHSFEEKRCKTCKEPKSAQVIAEERIELCKKVTFIASSGTKLLSGSGEAIIDDISTDDFGERFRNQLLLGNASPDSSITATSLEVVAGIFAFDTPLDLLHISNDIALFSDVAEREGTRTAVVNLFLDFLSLAPFVGPIFKHGDEAIDIASSSIKAINNADATKLATKSKFWTEATIYNGKKVYQRNDLFDPYQISTWQRNGETITGTNIERMAAGNAPIGYDGKSIEIHHLTQRDNSSLVELSSSFHKNTSSTIHINAGTNLPSGISRNQFDSWRKSYWKNRALDFMNN